MPHLTAGRAQNFKNDDDCVAFLKDEKVTAKLAGAKKLSEVSADGYDAIFFPGGHGPAIELPTDPANVQLVSQFWRAGKIVAAVCHGPAALVGATDGDGASIFKGRAATGFSNAEESAIDKVDVRLVTSFLLTFLARV